MMYSGLIKKYTTLLKLLLSFANNLIPPISRLDAAYLDFSLAHIKYLSSGIASCPCLLKNIKIQPPIRCLDNRFDCAENGIEELN